MTTHLRRFGQFLSLLSIFFTSVSVQAQTLSVDEMASLPDRTGYEGLRAIHSSDRRSPWIVGRPVEPVCGCRVRVSTMRIEDPLSCPPMRESSSERDADLVAVLIVDTRSIMKNLTCGRDGSNVCLDPVLKKPVIGESCCLKDDEYKAVLQDPMMSVLIPRVLATRLKGLRPALNPSKEAKPGLCGVLIDEKRREFTLPERFDGFVSRAWLHGVRRYRVVPQASVGELINRSNAKPVSGYEEALVRTGRSMGFRHWVLTPPGTD